MTEDVGISMKQDDLKSTFTRYIGRELGGVNQKHNFK